MIFFNVKEVKDYLLSNDRVYTIRKQRKNVGFDKAATGDWRNNQTVFAIAKVFIRRVGIADLELAMEHVTESGLYDPKIGVFESAVKWLELAKMMFGENLVMYYVKLVQLVS